eukprot:13313331-Ditylum_brightwellii.AAC.1
MNNRQQQTVKTAERTQMRQKKIKEPKSQTMMTKKNTLVEIIQAVACQMKVKSSHRKKTVKSQKNMMSIKVMTQKQSY